MNNIFNQFKELYYDFLYKKDCFINSVKCYFREPTHQLGDLVQTKEFSCIVTDIEKVYNLNMIFYKLNNSDIEYSEDTLDYLIETKWE